MYCIPGSEDDPNWTEENIDKVYSFLTVDVLTAGKTWLQNSHLNESSVVQACVVKLVSHHELHIDESRTS